MATHTKGEWRLVRGQHGCRDIKVPKHGIATTWGISNDREDAANARLIARAPKLQKALETIAKWEFATDGRKFDGNHKLVLKEVVRIAKQAIGRK